MDSLEVALPPVAPDGLPPELYGPINDLYVQIYSLVVQLNRFQGIMRSPNGHYWRLNISNAGVISTTDLGLTLP